MLELAAVVKPGLEYLGLSPFSASMCAQFMESRGCSKRLVQWVQCSTDSQAQLAVQAAIAAGIIQPAQRGAAEILPFLSSPGIWTHEPCMAELVAACAAAAPALAKEVQAVRSGEAGAAAGFQPYRAPTWAGGIAKGPGEPQGSSGTGCGLWSVCYMALHNVDCSAAQRMLPQVHHFLSAVPRSYGHSFLSAAAPHTHILPHHGPTNKKLRVQLPLYVDPAPSAAALADAPEHMATLLRRAEPASSAALRVGDSVVGLVPGQAIVFDDSFEHEAVAWGSGPRLVLIFDIWHPQLADAEVKVLAFIRSAQLRAAKALSAAGQASGTSDFYTVLAEAAKQPVSVDSVLPTGATD